MKISIPCRPLLQRQRGFTLVEAIVVMVISGILAGIMVLFIRQPTQNYVDAAARADLSDTADLALRRMARELHAALPNSVRLSSAGGVWWLQFIPTKAGGQYLAVEDSAASGTPLSFTASNAQVFSVVGPMPSVVVGDHIAIYNLGSGIDDAYTRSNLALVKGVVLLPSPLITYEQAGDTIVDGVAHPNNVNPFLLPAGQTQRSPDQRFFVVGTPVTFRCAANAQGTGRLERFTHTTFAAAQPTPPLSQTGALLANNVAGCDFNFTQAANLQTGLIGLTIALARPRAGGAANGLETVTLTHQIHVDNTP
jgi:MSHA biogenesis protein MshO